MGVATYTMHCQLHVPTRVYIGLDDNPGGGAWVELEGVVEGSAHHAEHMARVNIGCTGGGH